VEWWNPRRPARWRCGAGAAAAWSATVARACGPDLGYAALSGDARLGQREGRWSGRAADRRGCARGQSSQFCEVEVRRLGGPPLGPIGLDLGQDCCRAWRCRAYCDSAQLHALGAAGGCRLCTSCSCRPARRPCSYRAGEWQLGRQCASGCRVVLEAVSASRPRCCQVRTCPLWCACTLVCVVPVDCGVDIRAGRNPVRM
jgi:hypothetical protein